MLLIQGGHVLTMEGESYPKGDIWIKDGKIEGVGEALPVPEGARVIDASGKFVLPGMIDGHCHLGMWEDGIGFEGADGNEVSAPIMPHLRAIDGLNPMDRSFREAYEGGITAVATGPGSANVIGGQFAAIKTYGKRIDDMIIKAPLAMKCAFGENPKRIYKEKKQSPNTRMATAALLREALYKAKEYDEKLKRAEGDPSKKPAYDMKLEALLPVVRGELPMKMHVHRTDDIFTAIRIAKEFDIQITLEHCTEGHLIAEFLKEENFPAIVGPSLTERSKFELRNLSFETAGILANAGIKIAIMTDHPVIPLQYLPICAALAAKAGMPEEEALKGITIYPAEILGLSDRIGSIRKGKDADIVIWDGHPFSLQSEVAYTIIDGHIVYERE